MRNLKLKYCKELDAVAHPRQLLLQPELNGDTADTAFVVADDKIFAVQESGNVRSKVIAGRSKRGICAKNTYKSSISKQKPGERSSNMQRNCAAVQIKNTRAVIT